MIEEVLKVPLEPHVQYVVLEACVESKDVADDAPDEERDVEIPYIRYKIK